MSFIHRHADYLKQFDNVSKYESIVKKVCRYIRQSKLEFSHIAVAGISGMTIGGPVALRLKKNLIVVRKGEHSHSSELVEGVPINDKPFQYIIVDDCVDTGETVFNIYNGIHTVNKNATPLSVIEYYYRKVCERKIMGFVDFYREYYLGRNS
mgnify:CR=1 FL=1